MLGGGGEHVASQRVEPRVQGRAGPASVGDELRQQLPALGAILKAGGHGRDLPQQSLGEPQQRRAGLQRLDRPTQVRQKRPAARKPSRQLVLRDLPAWQSQEIAARPESPGRLVIGRFAVAHAAVRLQDVARVPRVVSHPLESRVGRLTGAHRFAKFLLERVVGPERGHDSKHSRGRGGVQPRGPHR